MHYIGIIVYCASVSIICLFICEQFEILAARFTSPLMSFFCQLTYCCDRSPGKRKTCRKKKTVPRSCSKQNLLACMADSKRALFARVFTAPTLICASRVAPCRQTKRLIIKPIHAYFTLVLRGVIFNVVGHACS